jgi:hypothetical protein
VSESIDFIVAAYAITWVVLIAYAVRLHRVSRRAMAQYREAGRAGGYHE